MGSIDIAVRLRASLRRGTVALIAMALLTAAAGTGVSLADSPGANVGAASSVVTVRKGDRGPAVKAVQRRLRLTADGVFGPITHRSVKRFQKRKRLQADGVVGPLTRRALRLRPFKASSVIRRSSRRRTAPRSSGGGLRGLPRVLVRIAECESGGNPRAVSPDGRYRGKYQFSRATWQRLGGTGDPAQAPEAEQDRVAAALLAAEGTRPWPACGR